MSEPFLDYGTVAASLPPEVTQLLIGNSGAIQRPTRSQKVEWKYSKIFREFGTDGCSMKDCPFHSKGDDLYKCALNLSDAVILAGYILPKAPTVNFCPHGRVRNADGMARVVQQAIGGPSARGWDQRPSWRGIVYFEGGPNLTDATGHIDLWDGIQAVHVGAKYSDAETIWFFRLNE